GRIAPGERGVVHERIWRNGSAWKEAAAEHHHHGHRLRRISGRDEDHLDVDVDLRGGGVVDVTDELLADNWHRPDEVVDGVGDGPGDFRDIGGDAADDFALEVLDDFGTALLPPHVRCRAFLAVLKRADV